VRDVSDKVLRIDRQVVYGALFIALLGLLVAGTVAEYRGVFQDNVVVTVESGRAGLTLTGGAPIKLHGVQIGHVASVAASHEGATIRLDIDRDKAADVPADVTAQIVPPTAFGAKYVQLTVPPSSSAGPIAAGAHVPATRVTVEVDQAFENLTRVLEAARPAAVDAALTAVAGTLDQRGRVLGALISQTDRYLTSINPSLRTLTSDLGRSAPVLDTYEAARPDLVGALEHAADLSDVVVRQRASLRALEGSLTGFSDQADILLASSQHGIVTSLALMRPVTTSLARYSPELACVVLGLQEVNGPMEAAIGGTNPGLTTLTRIVPGRSAYTYGQNLPLLGDDRGPACYGLPYVTASEGAAPPPVLHTGANPYAGSQDQPEQPTLATLVGLLSGGGRIR
jgi:phospholipid/cholesterol/gamma-HCH transport system substrate-binding protein